MSGDVTTSTDEGSRPELVEIVEQWFRALVSNDAEWIGSFMALWRPRVSVVSNAVASVISVSATCGDVSRQSGLQRP